MPVRAGSEAFLETQQAQAGGRLAARRDLRSLLERLWRLRRRVGAEERPASAQAATSEDEDEMVLQAAALHEFLEADRRPVPVDPLFREKLRTRLWTMVDPRSAAGPSSPSAGPEGAQPGKGVARERSRD
jgi:hypothetical protein